jgi:AcrR family transcriptional regulator
VTAPERPTGREEIREAVLEAAARRLAIEGPEASLRDIAKDAGVNLGLIHRHIGNKDELLRAVLEREVASGIATIERAGDARAALRRVFEGASTNGRYIRIIAWLLLREPAGLQHQDRYPGMAALRALANGGPEHADADRDARLMAAMAAIYGWTVFGPQLRAAFDVADEDRARIEQQIADVISGIAGPA